MLLPDPLPLTETLQRYWGYSAFRPLQEDIIRSVCAGRDTLGLMPTGGGKSLTFQVPAMIMPGICLVITPLLALMKDQVDNLKSRKIKATSVFSGMTREEMVTQLDNCIYGDYKFLYVSPERLKTELFLSKLSAMNISLLAIDESHCISQWGYDFRPSYLEIASIREALPAVPVLALTATATPEVVDDIQEKLHFREKNVFRKSFARTNLSYVIRRAEDKMQALIGMLEKVPGTAVVYVRSRSQTQEIAQLLQRAGISADYFHAGLKRETKTDRQNAWTENRCRVMVATNAFGMGIDKPDVRLVVHMDLPASLEEYFQEAGRAGRDEKQAYAVALCSKAEGGKLKKRITNKYPEKSFIVRVYEALGNFFEIAAGYGLYTVHDFSLGDFCSAYKFSLNQAQAALKILEWAGYIEYEEDPDNTSRMIILYSRDELYRAWLQDELTEEIIQFILRTYMGIFTEYVFIDESLIARRVGTTQDEVYQRLIVLAKNKIIKYVPRKHTPQIRFTRERAESNQVVLPRDIYESRKSRDHDRIEAVLKYINEESACRTNILLRYFGEQVTADCRTCDVCLQKTSLGIKRWEFNAIRDLLIDALAEGSKLLQELVEFLPVDSSKTLGVLRYLLDRDAGFELRDGWVTYTGSVKKESSG